MKNGGIQTQNQIQLDWLLFHSDHFHISIKKEEKKFAIVLANGALCKMINHIRVFYERAGFDPVLQ